MMDPRSSSALFKRAEQLKRWEESDTNKQSPLPKRASRIQFSSGIVFLAACTAGDKDEVQRLLKMGADINTANVDGLTALHQACIDDNLDMVEFLVSHGADINRGDNEGWTPLHATASCGFLSIARYLLENGADVAAVNYDGDLPVDIAETHDAMEELLQKAIEEKGVDCNKCRNAEVDALMSDAKKWAVNGYVEVRDPKTGGTPLHVAAAKGYIDVAETLLEECNVAPDCVDYEGWTPLHAAALWGQKEAAALLLKYGADPNLKNYSGQTCMDLVDPSISSWLAEASLKVPRRVNNNNNNNNNKPKRPALEGMQVDIQIKGQTDNIVNGENKPANNMDNDTILRRTHSFENDKTISPTERRDRDANTWNSPTNTSVNSSPTNTTTQTTVRRSFVPPVRDEESETQRKAHAKRVRETRRSTQGVTLDEIKSAEQLVKKKTGNGTAETTPPVKKPDEPTNETATFELEDAGRVSTRSSTGAATAAEATVTIPLRRPPSASTANTNNSTTTTTSHNEDRGEEKEKEKDRESSAESKSSSNNASPASTQAALNVIQRRRRPKRRSTGVGHVDMDDIVNDRGGGGEGDADIDNGQSGSERTEEGEEKDYKALYEASQSEVRRLRALLTTSEQQLREARATIGRLTQVNQNSLSEIDKREKRAMERKLSEMEEELKYHQALQAENQRLKDENGALIRVISKLSK